MSDRHGILSLIAAQYKEALSLATDGRQRDELESNADKFFEKAIELISPEFYKDLLARTPAMLSEQMELKRGFEEYLESHWGKALDLLCVVYQMSLELGERFNNEERPAASKESDFVFEALVGLHSRACLVTSEVISLLRSGHPAVALARWRTLHECAVLATVIGDNGRVAGFDDLAERYLLHDTIQNERDAKEYQLHHKALGVDRIPDVEMSRMSDDAKSLVSRFGERFKGDYGWALPLFPTKGRVTFKDLEICANLDHNRPYYGWANHGVHADSKGARLNRMSVSEGQIWVAGPSDSGLADAGQCTALSLHQVTASLIIRGRPQIADVSDMPELEALESFVKLANQAFYDCETSLSARSAKSELDE